MCSALRVPSSVVCSHLLEFKMSFNFPFSVVCVLFLASSKYDKGFFCLGYRLKYWVARLKMTRFYFIIQANLKILANLAKIQAFYETRLKLQGLNSAFLKGLNFKAFFNKHKIHLNVPQKLFKCFLKA